MKIMVTGCAGFIGFHVTKRLLKEGHIVLGLDNINNYYNVNLKYDRLLELGISTDLIAEDREVQSDKLTGLTFVKMDISNYPGLVSLFKNQKFDTIIHLAAQGGVRYSLENPFVYVQSNLVGFANILEICRQHRIEHLIYASSSSVYGNSQKIPFKENDNVDYPVSLYAATKKSNELMAHSYSHLYGFQTTGLRFFTVYGPWGRPDMAPFLFAKAMANGKQINIFNNGDMKRDFTYIDDIVEGVVKCIDYKINKKPAYNIFNIGNSKPVKLLDFVTYMEEEFGFKANKKMLPMQPGDVKTTYADTSQLENEMGYVPKTDLKDGLAKFVRWYKEYFKN
ncbi:NAD-dependent epimerase/dehydratase family protein [Flagellimonas eckloniae]|uniref:Capsule biosynthesis protein CapI n=1 Tax=Flagellimonas eckloniae TaxID=346185 RepID=A0A0N8WG62_9FLAO|nr:NAD-dependent epimerase/dehydratase family protein [Allomuricauda eckloniae]KQC30611.1 capsule biosynthesis protein CapI [Allomuricauda eckloniae]